MKLSKIEKDLRLQLHIENVCGFKDNALIHIQGNYAMAHYYGLRNLHMFYISDKYYGEIYEVSLKDDQVQEELGSNFWDSSLNTKMMKIRKYMESHRDSWYY